MHWVFRIVLKMQLEIIISLLLLHTRRSFNPFIALCILIFSGLFKLLLSH